MSTPQAQTRSSQEALTGGKRPYSDISQASDGAVNGVSSSGNHGAVEPQVKRTRRTRWASAEEDNQPSSTSSSTTQSSPPLPQSIPIPSQYTPNLDALREKLQEVKERTASIMTDRMAAATQGVPPPSTMTSAPSTARVGGIGLNLANVQDVVARAKAKAMELQRQKEVVLAAEATAAAASAKRLDHLGREIDELGRLVGSSAPHLPPSSAPSSKAGIMALKEQVFAEREKRSQFLDPTIRGTVRRKRRTFAFVMPGTHVRRAEALRSRQLTEALKNRAMERETNQENLVEFKTLGDAPPNVEWWDWPLLAPEEGGEPRDYPVFQTLPVGIKGEEISGLNAGGSGIQGVNAKEEVQGKGKDISSSMDDDDQVIPTQSMSTTQPVSATATTITTISATASEIPTQQESILTRLRPRPRSLMNVSGPSVVESRITSLVHHPRRLPPAVPEPVAAPKTAYLTKAQRMKKRKLERAARFNEERELIRAGLLPPPPPKRRLATLMHSMAAEIIADPTGTLERAKQEQAERIRKHEEANQARALTPQQKREKLLRKRREDTSHVVTVGVFRLGDLSDWKRRSRIERMAKRYELSGVVVMHPDCNLMVAEGGPKALKKLAKYLTHSIKWAGGTGGDEADSDSESDEHEEDRKKGRGTEGELEEAPSGKTVYKKCDVVWMGECVKPSFDGFSFKVALTRHNARQMLEVNGVPHYWDAGLTYRMPSVIH